MACIIKCRHVYWKDRTTNNVWPWTHAVEQAKRFDPEVAAKVIEFWNGHHHPEQRVNGKTIQSTMIGGILPLDATIVETEGD
jgi:hypothetical protein